MEIKSILKPEGSIMAGIATVVGVYGIYNLNLGAVNAVHATEANHTSHESSRKKAGYAALAFVGALTLITRDGNVGILGAGTIIAMEYSYRHAIMANPNTGEMEPQGVEQFQPAQIIPYPTAQSEATGTEDYYPGR
jgi:hypothetical protein